MDSKCLSGGIDIYLKSNNGFEKIPIKDLLKRSLSDLYLWDGYKWVKINKFRQYPSFDKRIELILSDGERICCTVGHKFILASGESKSAESISIGDKIKKAAGFPDSAETINVSDKQLTSLAYWFFRGSGNTKEGIIGLQNINNEQRIVVDFLKEFNCESITSTTIDNCPYIKVASKEYLEFTAKYVIGKLPKKRYLSSEFWDLSNTQIKVFINSLFGCVGANKLDVDSVGFNLELDSTIVSDLRIAAMRLGATFTTEIKNNNTYCIWEWGISPSVEVVDIREGKATFFYELAVDSKLDRYALSSVILTT